MLRLVEMPWWGWLQQALGALGVAGLVFARFAEHAPRHERFVHEDRWDTAHPVAQALDRSTAHVGGEGARIRAGQDEISVEMGPDRRFRFRGVDPPAAAKTFRPP